MSQLLCAACLAVEVLERIKQGREFNGLLDDAICVLKASIHSPETKPEGWFMCSAREWIGLTDEEISKTADAMLACQIESYETSGVYDFARALDARLKDKNS